MVSYLLPLLSWITYKRLISICQHFTGNNWISSDTGFSFAHTVSLPCCVHNILSCSATE